METSDFRAPWINDSGRLLYINSLLSEEEKEIFFIDMTKLDPYKTFSVMVAGIQKYFIGQDMVMEEDGYR